MAAGEGQTAAGYIQHHLQNLVFGKTPDGWMFAKTHEQVQQMGFWSIHVDTMFFSILMGVFFLWLFRSVAKKLL